MQEIAINEFIRNKSNYDTDVTDEGYKFVLYNSTSMVSELARGFYTNKELAIDYTVGYSINGKGCVNLNFRSSSDSCVDVGEIARRFGGGGHKHAAGANLDLEQSVLFFQSISDELR
jgi:nanoRNase/pAp phosphatase (c-di-AMP/oligoRNAs hydrolase)